MGDPCFRAEIQQSLNEERSRYQAKSEENENHSNLRLERLPSPASGSIR
jgi:hypothetical protein